MDAFSKIKAQDRKIRENKHIDTNKQNRVRCDAIKKGLGTSFEQISDHVWEPIAFTSRFLNNP